MSDQTNLVEFPNKELNLSRKIRALYLLETRITDDIIKITDGLIESEELYEAFDKIQDGIAGFCKCLIDEHLYKYAVEKIKE